MADVGGFRTKFGGFNKEDVLAYIDSLQEDFARQLEQAQQQAQAQREAYEKALGDANDALAQQFQALQDERAEQDKLQALINEQYEANRELREAAQLSEGEREEIAAAQREAVAERQKAVAAKAEAEAATGAVEVAQAENGRLQAQLAQSARDMEALRQMLATREQELTALRQKAEESARRCAALESERETLTAAAQQTVDLQAQLRDAQSGRETLEEQNRRYQQLVGDVGGFVVEVRAMGQRFLEDANARCEGRLTALSGAIAALSQELNAAAQELNAADRALEAQNSGASQRLDELARELERSAGNFESAPADTARFF